MACFSWSRLAVLAALICQVAVSEGKKTSSLRNSHVKNGGIERAMKADTAPADGMFSNAVASPAVTECVAGFHHWYYKFTFGDGCVLEGYSVGSTVKALYCDGSKTVTLDIGCTSPFANQGLGIVDFSIETLQDKVCACKQYCSYGSHTTTTVTTGDATHSVCMTTTQQQQTTTITVVDEVCDATKDKWWFHYVFADDCVLKGFSPDSTVTMAYCATGKSITLDISCSSPAVNVKGFPAVKSYGSGTLQGDCTCQEYCSYGDIHHINSPPAPVPVPVPMVNPVPVPAPVPVPTPVATQPMSMVVPAPAPIGIAGGPISYNYPLPAPLPVPVPVPAPAVPGPAPIGIAGGPAGHSNPAPSPNSVVSVPSSSSNVPFYIYKCPCSLMNKSPTSDCSLVCSSMLDMSGNVAGLDQCNISNLPQLGSCQQSSTNFVYIVTVTKVEISITTGTVTGTIWSDSNSDMTVTSGETTYQDVTVTLITTTGEIISQTTTDSSGMFSFYKIDQGSYFITVTNLPAGVILSGQETNGMISVEVTGNKTTEIFITTSKTTGSIQGTIWYDVNGDGKFDEQKTSLVSALTVTLTDSNGKTIGISVTTSEGKYSFETVSAGVQTITLEKPSKSIQVTVVSNEVTILNIGFPSPTGSIAGNIYNSVTLSPLPGIPVTATDKKGYEKSTTTDDNGNYEFPSLPTGDYTVKPEATEGFTVTTYTTEGTVTPFSSSELPSVPVIFNGQTTLDFGMKPVTGSIYGTVFADSSPYDGVQDSGEAGIQGIVVKVWSTSSTSTPVSTTTTDASGYYIFNSLPSGSYKVTFTTTYTYTVTFTGPLVSESGTTTNPIIISNAYVAVEVDVGLYQTPTVSSVGGINGYVWVDYDKNGIKNSNHSGLVDCSVSVKGSDGTIITTTTDTFGFYFFAVITGTYEVIFVNPNPDVYYFFGNMTEDNQANSAGVAGNVLVAPESNSTASAGLEIKPGVKCKSEISNDINIASGGFGSTTNC